MDMIWVALEWLEKVSIKNFLRLFRFNVTADLNMMSVLFPAKADEAVHGGNTKKRSLKLNIIQWSIIHYIILVS